MVDACGASAVELGAVRERLGRVDRLVGGSDLAAHVVDGTTGTATDGAHVPDRLGRLGIGLQTGDVGVFAHARRVPDRGRLTRKRRTPYAAPVTDRDQPEDWATRLEQAERHLAERESSDPSDTEELEALADERDRIADERDALAQAMDELAAERDRDAFRRDVRASTRDRRSTAQAAQDDPGFADRFLSADDRDAAAGDRSDSIVDRRRAAEQRARAAEDRHRAAGDREAARAAADEAAATESRLRADLSGGSVLGQAQGRLMQRYNVSVEAATEMLEQLAARQHLDVHEVAERVARLGPGD